MPDDLLQIGMRAPLAGVAVLLIGLTAGVKLSTYRDWAPVRLVRVWIDCVISKAIYGRSWIRRATLIFCNNALVLGLLVLVGALPGAAWPAVLLVGFFMGVAVRLLHSEHTDDEVDAKSTQDRSIDGLAIVGLTLNLIEVPAIVAALGLCMGQQAARNGMSSAAVWHVFGLWIAPALAVAAAGESLWIGRLQPFHRK